MPSLIYNEFKRASAAGEIAPATDDIRVALVMANSTCDSQNDAITTVGDFTDIDEMDGANYSSPGLALANEAVNKDDANDRAEFDADDVTWIALGNGSRAVKGALVYKFVTSLALSIPIAFIEFGTPQNPSDSDFTVQWNVEGILQFT